MPEFEGPERVAAYLTENGYNGRKGEARVRKYSEIILHDILSHNSTLAAMAESGNISYVLQSDFSAGASTVNLALGPVNSDVDVSTGDVDGFDIANVEPDDVWLAVRVRNLMKKVGRNRKNRMNEMVSMAVEAQYNEEDVVTGGLIATSNAETVHYKHLDEDHEREDVRDNLEKLVRELPGIQRNAGEESSQLDAVSVIITDHDGISGETSVVTDPPSPPEDSRIHYDNFIRTISSELDSKFLGRPDPLSAPPSELIDRHEGNALDYKRALPRERRKIIKDVIGFLNTGGGIVIIGVDDSEDVRPLRLAGIDDVESTQGKLSTWLREELRPWPVDKIQLEAVEVDDTDLLLIRVAESTDRLYDWEGRFYIRVGEANLPMQYEDMETFIRRRIVREHGLDELRD